MLISMRLDVFYSMRPKEKEKGKTAKLSLMNESYPRPSHDNKKLGFNSLNSAFTEPRCRNSQTACSRSQNSKSRQLSRGETNDQHTDIKSLSRNTTLQDGDVYENITYKAAILPKIVDGWHSLQHHKVTLCVQVC